MKDQFIPFTLVIAIVYTLGIFTPLIFDVNAMEEQLVTISSGESFAQANIVAVTNSGEGILSKANVEIREGEGRVLISTMPFIEPTTQFSLEIAKNVAEKITGISLENKDIIFFVSESSADLIGGPSAGAAFTTAAIAAIEGRDIKDDVTVTGTIQRDGTIGPVGGLIEKLTASAANGDTLFLIPEGQEIFTVFDEVVVTRQIGIFSFRTNELVPKQINLKEFGREQGIEVKEVRTIEEVITYLLN